MYQDNDNTMQMTHAMTCAPHTLNLSQYQCDIKSVVNHKENVTCDCVLFTHSVGCSRLPSAVNDLTTTFFSKKLVKVSL